MTDPYPHYCGKPCKFFVVVNIFDRVLGETPVRLGRIARISDFPAADPAAGTGGGLRRPAPPAVAQ
jgi:hypothetical protein